MHTCKTGTRYSDKKLNRQIIPVPTWDPRLGRNCDA